MPISAPPKKPTTITEITKSTNNTKKYTKLSRKNTNKNIEAKAEDIIPPIIATITPYFTYACPGSRFLNVNITPKIVPNAN